MYNIFFFGYSFIFGLLRAFGPKMGNADPGRYHAINILQFYFPRALNLLNRLLTFAFLTSSEFSSLQFEFSNLKFEFSNLNFEFSNLKFEFPIIFPSVFKLVPKVDSVRKERISETFMQVPESEIPRSRIRAENRESRFEDRRCNLEMAFRKSQFGNCNWKLAKRKSQFGHPNPRSASPEWKITETRNFEAGPKPRKTSRKNGSLIISAVSNTIKFFAFRTF